MTSQYDSVAPIAASRNAIVPPACAASTTRSASPIVKLAPLCPHRMAEAAACDREFAQLCATIQRIKLKCRRDRHEAATVRPAASRHDAVTVRPARPHERSTQRTVCRTFVFRDETGDGSLVTFETEVEALSFAGDWERMTGRATHVLEVLSA